MEDKDLDLEKITRKIKKQEKISLRRSIIFSFIPILIALVLLWITGSQLIYYNHLKNQAKKELGEAKNRLSQVQDAISRVETELNKKKEQVRLSKLQTETVLQENMTRQSLQRKINLKIKRNKLKIKDTYKEDQGYMVVMGSFRDINSALKKVKRFREQISEDVKLYYAVNDYYAAALGIIINKKMAQKKLQNVRQFISDAYIYGSWAFPYEIELQNP